MMSLTFGLFNQVSGLGPLGPLVSFYECQIEILLVEFNSFYFKVRLSYSISILRQRLLTVSSISIGSLAASGRLMMALVRMG